MWIDGLRADLAVFFSSARAMCRAMQEIRSESQNEPDVELFRFNNNQINSMRLNGADALYRIKLRLNKKEAEHQELDRLLTSATDIQNRLNIEKSRDYTGALEAIDRAASYSQDILKTEWERVKRGEKPFYIARSWAMPLIMFLSIMFIVAILVSDNEPNKPIQPTAEAAAD